jgi:D-alanyl-D-alanine carboxypeptidase
MQNYFKIIALIFIFPLTENFAPAQQTNNIQTLAELRERIQTQLAQPRFDGAIWGVKIISLDSGQTIFEDHADRLMSPASNSKLYTGALALDKFGGDYQIVTPIYATAKPNRFGTVHGNLIIAGHGDPSWNARRFGTNFGDIFEPFVSALTHAGVRRVTGDLIADGSFFSRPAIWFELDGGRFTGSRGRRNFRADARRQHRTSPRAARRKTRRALRTGNIATGDGLDFQQLHRDRHERRRPAH